MKVDVNFIPKQKLVVCTRRCEGKKSMPLPMKSAQHSTHTEGSKEGNDVRYQGCFPRCAPEECTTCSAITHTEGGKEG